MSTKWVYSICAAPYGAACLPPMTEVLNYIFHDTACSVYMDRLANPISDRGGTMDGSGGRPWFGVYATQSRRVKPFAPRVSVVRKNRVCQHGSGCACSRKRWSRGSEWMDGRSSSSFFAHGKIGHVGARDRWTVRHLTPFS